MGRMASRTGVGTFFRMCLSKFFLAAENHTLLCDLLRRSLKKNLIKSKLVNDSRADVALQNAQIYVVERPFATVWEVCEPDRPREASQRDFAEVDRG